LTPEQNARTLPVMEEPISRRQLLRRLGAAGCVIGGSSLLGAALVHRGQAGATPGEPKAKNRDFRVPEPQPSLPRLVIAKSTTDRRELVRRAIEGLGGMRRFVSRGDIVAIKPNIGWDRLPVHAANTNPEVVAELVRLCLDAGAKRVVVTDYSCNEPNRSFQRSGIWRAAHAVGAAVVIPSETHFRTLRLGGEMLDLWPIYTPLVDADKVINVPVAKHHNLAQFTGAMKNWYGILGGRRNRLHQDIDLSIADLASFLRPTLTVMDATRVLVRNGPTGGNIEDAEDRHQVIAGLDEVAIDAYSSRLIGVDPSRIRYLELAEARGLGRRDLSALSPREV